MRGRWLPGRSPGALRPCRAGLLVRGAVVVRGCWTPSGRDAALRARAMLVAGLLVLGVRVGTSEISRQADRQVLLALGLLDSIGGCGNRASGCGDRPDRRRAPVGKETVWTG